MFCSRNHPCPLPLPLPRAYKLCGTNCKADMLDVRPSIGSEFAGAMLLLVGACMDVCDVVDKPPFPRPRAPRPRPRPAPLGCPKPPLPLSLTGVLASSFSPPSSSLTSSPSSSFTTSMASPLTSLTLSFLLLRPVAEVVELTVLDRRRCGGRSIELRRSMPSFTIKKS